jgi:hypothetical protein
MVRVAILVAVSAILSAANADEPKELRDARRGFESLKHPTEADRVLYVTRLVRLRESFTRADYKILETIDAEVIRHPMPTAVDAGVLRKSLVGRWQSPRRPYFYHADGTWASNEDIAPYQGWVVAYNATTLALVSATYAPQVEFYGERTAAQVIHEARPRQPAWEPERRTPYNALLAL